MSDLVQVLAVSTSALLLVVVLELVRRRRLREEYSFIWIGCAAALLLLSLWRELLHLAARLLDVHYPPALLLLLLILFVFVASLHFALVASRQRQQIEALVEEVALLDAEVRALRDSVGAVPAPEVIPRAAQHGSQATAERHLRRQ